MADRVHTVLRGCLGSRGQYFQVSKNFLSETPRERPDNPDDHNTHPQCGRRWALLALGIGAASNRLSDCERTNIFRN